MFIRDVDKKINMRVILRVRQETEFFNLTNEVQSKLPSFIYSKEGATWLSVYFPKGQKDQRMNLIYNKFGAIENEDSFVINSRINNLEDLNIINELSNLKSFVLNRADMKNGFLNVYARFHRNEIEEVSHLLSEYTSDQRNSRIEWLGPSPGIIRIMDLINNDYPISLVTYNVPITEEDDFFLSSGQNGLIEIRNNVTSKGEISAILYSDHKIENLPVIDEKEMIYSVNLRNEHLRSVRMKANEKHLLRLRHFVKVVGKRLQVSVFVPSSSIHDLYSIVYELARNIDKRIFVENLLPYGPEIWDIL